MRMSSLSVGYTYVRRHREVWGVGVQSTSAFEACEYNTKLDWAKSLSEC